ARCQSGIAEIDMAFDTARTGPSQPRRTLTVTAPVMFGRLHVLPIVLELLRQHADLQVRLLLLDRLVRMVDEGVDVAVRIADLPDGSLRRVRVGQGRRGVSASRDYPAVRGRPAPLPDLRDHDVIWVEDESAPHRGWGQDAVRRSGRSTRLQVNIMDAAIAASAAGLGVVRTFCIQVSDSIGERKLEHVPAY